LVPEVLDAVDMPLPDEPLAVVDPSMVEFRDVKDVVGREAVGIDHRIGPDLLADDGKNRVFSCVWYDQGMHIPAALKQAKDRHFATRSAPPFALPDTTEIALVYLDLATEQLRYGSLQAGRDKFAQLVEEQRCSVAVYAKSAPPPIEPSCRLQNASQAHLEHPPQGGCADDP
jgi:hypothetical protein